MLYFDKKKIHLHLLKSYTVFEFSKKGNNSKYISLMKAQLLKIYYFVFNYYFDIYRNFCQFLLANEKHLH